ncbi:MAG: S41 family peptidase [Chloroflexi bacterium]|nr:S41 family peptidase [Chloroflexota bacterium]
MRPNAARNALASAFLALIGVLLVAAGFLAAIIVVDGNEVDTAPTAVADVPAMPPPTVAASGRGAVYSALIDEIIAILEDDFVEPVDGAALLEAAINGMVTSLGDPHVAYIDPPTFAVSRGDFRGAFQGIGATIAQQDNYVVIVQPLPGTPAERAGLRSGGIILEVDGESTAGWSVNEAVLRLRGEIGSTVELLIRHADGSEERVAITRDEILVASVDTEPPGGVLMDGGASKVADLAYIRIHTFTARTPTELRRAVEDVGDVSGLILDLRSNRGGLLVETMETADLFLDGQTIVVQVDRDGHEQVFRAEPGVLTDLPLVILQDEFSASGSELLAAALQENDRAVVVGTPSFGKGTVSLPRELSNGGALYVSIARWLTPDRNLIEGRGVIPDIAVELTAEDVEEQRDVALHRAIDVLRARVPTSL